MRKLRSLLAVLLAALIVLVMVPFFSVKVNASVEEPATTYSYTKTVELETVVECNCPKTLSFSDKKAKVVIFGNLYDCGKSRGTFSNLQAIKKYYMNEDLDVYFFQLVAYESDFLKEKIPARNHFGKGDFYIYDGYAPSSYNSKSYGLYNWLHKAAVDTGVASDSSFTMPLVGFFDSNGRLKGVSTGYLSFDDLYAALKLIGKNISYDVVIDSNSFPDSNFRKYVSDCVDKDSNGKLSRDEIIKTTSISCEDYGISDISGLELFIRIDYLNCSNNQLKELDVSNNNNLLYLYCQNNKLVALNLTGCTDINFFNCSSNQLSDIEFDDNIFIQTFNCANNKLKQLNLSKKRKLESVNCSNNSITVLNLSGSNNIDYLNCSYNQISYLSLTNLSELSELNCSNNKLSSLSVSFNTELRKLDCSGNNLSEINIKLNKNLIEIKCYDTNIRSLDIGNNPNLEKSYKEGVYSDKGNYLIFFGIYDSWSCRLFVSRNTVVKQNGKNLDCPNFGWKNDNKGWYFVVGDSYVSSDWLYRDAWYYFNKEGYMVTGWRQIGSSWYYFDSEGKMLYEWQKINGYWYYFGTNGVMKTGWQPINGEWYFFTDAGNMKTGWLPNNGTWYYFVDSGSMVKGWRFIDGAWYYFKADGSMAAGEFCGGYWINRDGTWTYQYKAEWKKDSNGWYYIDSTGWYARNESYKIDGKDYYFNSEGYCTNP